MARILSALAAAAGALALAGAGVAGEAVLNAKPDAGLFREVAHKHQHFNGHKLLGANLKKDGKHSLGKLGSRDVSAEVKGGKVTNMSAGELTPHRVKSSKAMAGLAGGVVRAAWTPALQLAQYDTSYYAYCFDDGVSYTCYWYPASDVNTTDYTWDPYDPTY